MPKKTKKEKILASYRRKIKLLEQIKNNQISSLKLNQKIEEKIKNQNVDNNQENKQEKKYFYSKEDFSLKFFFIDLKKSLIITVFIISLEIILYYANLIK